VQFQVTFTFPASPAETPLHIKRLEMETGLFSYTLGNLYETMFFDQISITTSNSNIKVEVSHHFVLSVRKMLMW